MPIVKCKRCGSQTNSVTSNYWLRRPFINGEADGCYLRYIGDTNTMVEGCALDMADKMTKSIMLSMLSDSIKKL